MDEQEVINILNKIHICLKNNSKNTAKDLIKIEIENLKGITKEKCKHTKYYYYDYYCRYCNNLNCNSNKR